MVRLVIPSTKQIESRMLDLPDPFLREGEEKETSQLLFAPGPVSALRTPLPIPAASFTSPPDARRERTGNSQSGDGVEAGVPSCNARSHRIGLETV